MDELCNCNKISNEDLDFLLEQYKKALERGL